MYLYGTPDPLKNEFPLAWALRSAYNHQLELNEFISFCAGKNTFPSNELSELASLNIEKAAKRLCLSIQSVSYLSRASQILVHHQGIEKKGNSSIPYYFNFCSACMSRKFVPRISFTWFIPYASYCDKHRSILLTMNCSNCNKYIVFPSKNDIWKRSFMDFQYLKCRYCKTPLHEMPIRNDSKIKNIKISQFNHDICNYNSNLAYGKKIEEPNPWSIIL